MSVDPLHSQQLHIGIVGAGGFSLFAASSFLTVTGISITGVTDIVQGAAQRFSEIIGCKTYQNPEELLADPDVDLVYIATPPSLHYEQSRQALHAGKHVICEKPAALRTVEAEELAAYAKQHGLLYSVNLMQRYNSLYDIVSTIIHEKWLGDFVHGFFENYASDEKLIPEHWFWDRAQSGGIFIEHGVHFFDMFSGWLGKGQLLHSFEINRLEADRDISDRVQAVVLYEHGPVNFYHGFNQPKVLDRQEMRLQFDRGDITLYEWIPVKIRLHGLVSNDVFIKIKELFPDATLVIHDPSVEEGYHVKGKFKDISYDNRVTMVSGDIDDKMKRYEELVIAMIRDQWAWILDRSHVRKIDDRNAVESLRIAEDATLKSEKFTR